MKIQYIIHADFELPGAIETWARQNRFEENTCRPYAGEKLPSYDDFDLLIVMGGPQSPLAIEKAPYLAGEIALIRETLKREKPVLGFCLGAQLIGEALGAKTGRSPNKEVGVFPIELTEEGRQDPLLEGLPQRFDVVHWHNDMPGLTAEAKVLAFSQGCPRQIVRYLPYAYGFQCHPEPMRQNIEAMIRHCPEDLAPGTFVQTAEKFLAQDFQGINQKLIQILDNFVSIQTAR